MSSLLSVDQTLQRLALLKALVRDFIAREQKLEHEFQRRAAQETARAQAAGEQLASASSVSPEALWSDRQAALRNRHTRRGSRLREAIKSSLQQGLNRIELKEGRKKYELQKCLLDTERNRKHELAANDDAYEVFKSQLAENREGFIARELEAQAAFRGYRSFKRFLYREDAEQRLPVSDEHQVLDQLTREHQATQEELTRFRQLPLPRFFRYLPFWLLLVLLILGHAALVPALRALGIQDVTHPQPAVSLAVLVVLLAGLYLIGSRAKPSARRIAENLARARRLHNAAMEMSALRHTSQAGQIETRAQVRTQELNEAWSQTVAEAAAARQALPERVEMKAARATARHERYHRQQLEALEREQSKSAETRAREVQIERQHLSARHQTELTRLQHECETQWQSLQAEWESRSRPLFAELETAQAEARRRFLEWKPDLWKEWSPPAQFSNAARFGELEVDLPKFCGGWPSNPRLASPGPTVITLPLLLSFPDQPSLLLETSKSGGDAVAATFNNIILRLLSQAAPGRFRFTIIDPVKLGQSFAGIMHLADFEENLINSRIWTQPGEIDQRLADLNDHMEKVIQMYLRNEYATIAEYNQQAGNIAEKYHYLVVADFPVNFGETAVRRLINIASSGARCGVFTLVHWDRRQPLPPGLVVDELRQNSICLSRGNDIWLLTGQDMAGLTLRLDPPPDPDLATDFLHQVGLSGKDANRVEVPFEQVAPQADKLWSLETADELRVPMGRTGATKLQYLAIGKGTRQHALVAGKTGSGKSTLFHVLITNLSLWYGPDEVEFYLVDFKKGVEFKCYATARLPHARVVAIESDREFGLSVLQRVDDELRQRGDLFRDLGVQDLAGYKKAGGTRRMPRCLLLIDEFQELFVEDDRISQGAAVLLDRIVRQGRAFGIHVILGSQTLGGAYTLARTTIGQMVIRIALQCNEADAYLIMDDNNPAPRLLSRPGEGIYNDMAGALEGNSPFQAVWLSDREREQYLDQIRAKAEALGGVPPAPFVFEGNAPGDIRDNAPLNALLAAENVGRPVAGRFWLGAPNAIKGPTEAVLQRQSGHHLLLVGQREETMLAILSVGLIGLAAQYPKDAVRFVYLDSTPPESPQQEWLQRVVRALPHDVVLARGGNLSELFRGLTDEMKRRADDETSGTAPTLFLFVHGLQNFKKLRQEEDFGFGTDDSQNEASPAAMLNELISGGAPQGMHVIASCDTFNNVSRFLPRKALSEFEMRVLFQMSANDSASLIDNPKASTLGMHRALFYNEHEGYLETFRPYALPSADWLEHVAQSLARR